jgi:hypothetical protein
MKPSVETVIENIVLSREICNHGGRLQGSHLVQSLLDLFLGLGICAGHIASDGGWWIDDVGGRMGCVEVVFSSNWPAPTCRWERKRNLQGAGTSKLIPFFFFVLFTSC